MILDFYKKNKLSFFLYYSPTPYIRNSFNFLKSRHAGKNCKLAKDILLIISWLTINIIAVLAIEFFQRGSISKLIFYIKSNYISLIVNFLICLSITSLAFLCKKKIFFMVILSSFIFIPGIANGFMWKLRGTPLTIADFYGIKEGIAIAHEYANIKSIIIGICFFALFISFLVFLWKYVKEWTLLNNNKVGIILLIILPLFLCTAIFINKNVKNENLSIMLCDLNASYMKNGFLYSFINTASGLQNIKPENYNKNNIESIKQDVFNVNNNTVYDNNKNPNIIIIQLESVFDPYKLKVIFFDPYKLKNITFNKDPMPNIKRLIKQNSSGSLKVPTYGGGTIKTEFEVITGMPISNLKAGTLPNNDILKKQPIESIAYVLDDKNYNTSVVHNFFESFYTDMKLLEIWDLKTLYLSSSWKIKY